jgi:hypothetical protein
MRFSQFLKINRFVSAMSELQPVETVLEQIESTRYLGAYMEAQTPAFAFGALKSKLKNCESPLTPAPRKSSDPLLKDEEEEKPVLTKKTQEEELAEEFEQFKRSTTTKTMSS